METVIILSVVGILLVGCWQVVRYWRQLETDAEKWTLILIIVCWVPSLIAIIVSAWLAPFLIIGYAVAFYLFSWAFDWICFRLIDWYIARANRGNRVRRTDDQTRQAAKGPAQHKHSLPRTTEGVE